MKISINTWGFHPELTFLERIKQAKKFGFDAIEINFEENCKCPILSWQTNDNNLIEIKKLAENEGVDISSICTELFWKYSFTSSSTHERIKAIDLAKKMIEFAVKLNASSVVIIPGIVHAPIELRTDQKIESSDNVWEISCENLKKIADFTHGSGVILGIENVYFNKFLLSPLEVVAFIKAIDRSNVKVHLDLGNANLAGIVEDWIVTLGDLIYAIHVKDSVQGDCSLKTFCLPGLGSINWNNVRQALQKIKYTGFLISEQSFVDFTDHSSISFLAKNIKNLCIVKGE